MSSCCVPFCGREKSQVLSCFRLPKRDEIREKWLEFLQDCGKKTDVNKEYRICEIHFDPYDVIQGFSRKILRSTAVPSFNKNQVKIKHRSAT